MYVHSLKPTNSDDILCSIRTIHLLFRVQMDAQRTKRKCYEWHLYRRCPTTILLAMPLHDGILLTDNDSLRQIKRIFVKISMTNTIRCSIPSKKIWRFSGKTAKKDLGIFRYVFYNMLFSSMLSHFIRIAYSHRTNCPPIVVMYQNGRTETSVPRP